MPSKFRDGDDDLFLAAFAYGFGGSMAELAGEDEDEEEEEDNELTDEEEEEDEAARFLKSKEQAA